MKNRIFAAIPASPGLRQKVADWQAGSNLPVRWLGPETLHLTLLPPWYADEKELAEAKEKCRAVQRLGIKRFRVQFTEISFGPGPKAPRLVWAAGPAPEELLKLKSLLDKHFAVKNDRPFQLHLTIGRFKPEDFRAFSNKALKAAIDWLEPIESFALIRSTLSDKGAAYNLLENYELQ